MVENMANCNFERVNQQCPKAVIRSSCKGVANDLAEKLCYWQIALNLLLQQMFSAKSASNPLIRRTDVGFRLSFSFCLLRNFSHFIQSDSKRNSIVIIS